MKLRSTTAMVATLLLAATGPAEAAGWLVRTDSGDCITDQLTGLTARARGTGQEDLDQAALANPQAYEFKIRKSGGMFTQGVFHDFSQVDSIVVTEVDTSTRGKPQQYKVRIADGETFEFNDNFGALYLCPKGAAPARGNAPASCGAVYYVRLMCERLDNGQIGPLHLRFDSNGNGRTPPGAVTQLKELRRVDDAFLAQQRQITERARAAFARQEEQAQARARNERAATQAKQEQQRQKTEAALRAPPGTSMFCSSASELLMPGESLGNLSVQCDGMPLSVQVRALTGAGWSITNQVNTPTPSINGGIGMAVTFQALKSR